MSGTFQPKNTASTSARTHGGTSPVATGPIADTNLFWANVVARDDEHLIKRPVDLDVAQILG